MTARLKNWSGWIIARNEWESRHRDGRRNTQVIAAVRASSMKAAAQALTEVSGGKITPSHVRTYMSETWNEATIAALDAHPPGTVLLHPLDPGGTVKGTNEWIPA